MPADARGVGMSTRRVPGADPQDFRGPTPAISGVRTGPTPTDECPVKTGTLTHVTPDRQIRDVEDFAALVAQFVFFVGLVVDEVAGDGQDVESKRPGEHFVFGVRRAPSRRR